MNSSKKGEVRCGSAEGGKRGKGCGSFGSRRGEHRWIVSQMDGWIAILI